MTLLSRPFTNDERNEIASFITILDNASGLLQGANEDNTGDASIMRTALSHITEAQVGLAQLLYRYDTDQE